MRRVSQEEEEEAGEIILAMVALIEGAVTLVPTTLLFISDESKSVEGNSLNSSIASNLTTMIKYHRMIVNGTAVVPSVEHLYQCLYSC